MKRNFTKCCFFLFFVCLNCFAQDEFPKGEVIERVSAKADTTQSYSLYLPKNYNPEKKWAILYAFEPIARGKLPVTIFQEAAEKYGYIVIGSYNSRNGLDGGLLSKALKILLADTQKRFSIDERRVYTTGFSGGARVATLLAASCNCVTGVIGSGAGFPPQLKPKPNLPFVYFNAIGFDDYNYYEIRALRKSLEEVKTIHRVEKFDGVHQWLTKTVAENALAWMQLNAMKKGLLPKDEKFIDENFQARIAVAENYYTKQQFLEAFQDFSDIVTDFRGLRDVSEFEKKVETLKKSDDFKKAVREEANQISAQENHARYLLGMGAKFQDPEEKIAILPQLRRYIADLQKDSEEKEDSSRRRIARRSLNSVFAETYETALFRYEREKKYDLALINFELANEIYPKSPRVPYDRARVYVLNGQTKKALDFLEKAVEFGFRNWQEMETEKGFEKIRQEEKFQKLLAQAKENSKQER